MKLTSFTQLKAWQEAHILTLMIYEATNKFPKEEKYCLTDQVRRSVISIPSNIAEGFALRSRKEKLKHYYVSKGSLFELQAQILIARDLKYMSKINFDKIAEDTKKVNALIMGLIKNAQDRKK